MTGGSLGMTPECGRHFLVRAAIRRKRYFYVIALVLWLGGLAVWRSIDRGIGSRGAGGDLRGRRRRGAVGIDVMREKLRVTVVSAALTALGGAMFGPILRCI